MLRHCDISWELRDKKGWRYDERRMDGRKEGGRKGGWRKGGRVRGRDKRGVLDPCK